MGRPGKIDERITIQSYSSVSDGGGGFTKTWADLPAAPTVWANVQTKSGGEKLVEGGTSNASQAAFTIRNRSDLDEKCRILWDGGEYNIRLIEREGSRAMYLRIIAEEGVSN